MQYKLIGKIKVPIIELNLAPITKPIPNPLCTFLVNVRRKYEIIYIYTCAKINGWQNSTKSTHHTYAANMANA